MGILEYDGTRKITCFGKKVFFLYKVCKLIPLLQRSRHQLESTRVSCQHTKNNQWHTFQQEWQSLKPILK